MSNESSDKAGSSAALPFAFAAAERTLVSASMEVTLASTFCIPSVGGTLGFLINGAANLPGPGATSLPGTLELLP